MNVLILQPPIVQLNTAYPSGAYLHSFFTSQGCRAQWIDLSLLLYKDIFSRAGLSKLFSLCEKKAAARAEKAEREGDSETAFQLRRYISEKNLWINWIDCITAILSPGTSEHNSSGFENAHRFVFGAHVPRGNRMERFLAGLDREPTTDDARSLASFALADIADFIAAVFDEHFSLVRYAESLTISQSSFAQVASGADSPVMSEFYIPLLEKLFGAHKPFDFQIVCISVPFAGTFAAALATGRFLKEQFGRKTYISFGGGFINTELRETAEPLLAEYCDALCYDRGYASYRQLIASVPRIIETKNAAKPVLPSQIYKMRQFFSDSENTVSVIEPAQGKPEDIQFENETTSALIPDFSDIDFSQYPRLTDDTNPMHRLWSDGAWIKAYMAHGCYWHKCAFCDVTLDYVCGYRPVNVEKLYDGLLSQCRKKGIYGIHFVDEAMPPALMISFARKNIENGSPITWWGNIRFEKSFTRDVADFLAAGGLIGVSAGLESATGNGLTAIHKGTDLPSIVGACCAFKEAGILVHAYMIYGYWWEKPLDLINSMETLRQFYENRLLDSCFWHKFVLTRHSRVYKEWKEGTIPDLHPIEPAPDAPLFAHNGIHFSGEQKSEKYGAALANSLEHWMHGKRISTPVQSWFNFPVPKPTVARNCIARYVSEYEKKRDEAFKKPVPSDPSKTAWLGGETVQLPENKIGWIYMGEWFTERKDAPESQFRGKGLCVLP